MAANSLDFSVAQEGRGYTQKGRRSPTGRGRKMWPKKLKKLSLEIPQKGLLRQTAARSD